MDWRLPKIGTIAALVRRAKLTAPTGSEVISPKKFSKRRSPKDTAYRFNDNPKEKELHDKFLEVFKRDTKTLSSIIFGWSDTNQNVPNYYLTENEEQICLNMIQWLGSPVGQGFLRDCGFEIKN